MRKLCTISLILLLASTLAFGARYTHKQLQMVDVFGKPVTNISSITVLNAGTSTNATIYADSAGADAITVPLTTTSTNTTFTQYNGFFHFWSADADYKVTVTEGTSPLTVDNLTGSDTRLFYQAEYIGSVSDLALNDANDLTFGTDTDVTCTWDNTNTALLWTTAADNTEFRIGTSGGNNFTFNVYTGTGVGLKIDPSGLTFIVDGLDASINTDSNYDTKINTGTSTGAVTIGSSTSGVWAIDGTSTGTINCDAAMGITTTDAGADITVNSILGRVIIEGEEDATDAVIITADGGTSSTLTIFNDTGTGASSIGLLSDVGGITATASAGLVALNATGATAGDMTLTAGDDFAISAVGLIGIQNSAAGQDVTIGSTLGSIAIEAEEDAALAILITADGGTSSTMRLHNDTGTAAGSIELLSDVGGITATASAGPVVLTATGATAGDMTLTTGDDLAITTTGDATITTTGTLSVAGSAITNQKMLVENVTANDTLTTAESGMVYVVDGNTATVTLHLPAVGAGDDGCYFTVIDVNEAVASDVTMEPGTGDSINGAAADVGFSSDGADELPCACMFIYDHSNTNWVALPMQLTTAWDSDGS